jgi:hypothetical protein
MDIDRTYFMQLPLRSGEYNYEFNIRIGDSTYILWIYFNRRMGRWILNIKDDNNDYIAMGIPILIGSQMTSRFSDPRINELKVLFAYNLQSKYAEIGEFDLGKSGTLLVAKELE